MQRLKDADFCATDDVKLNASGEVTFSLASVLHSLCKEEDEGNRIRLAVRDCRSNPLPETRTLNPQSCGFGVKVSMLIKDHLQVLTMRFDELSESQRDCHLKGQLLPKEDTALLDALRAELLVDQTWRQTLKTVTAGKKVLDSSPQETGYQEVLADCHELAKEPRAAHLIKKQVRQREGEPERERQREGSRPAVLPRKAMKRSDALDKAAFDDFAILTSLSSYSCERARAGERARGRMREGARERAPRV